MCGLLVIFGKLWGEPWYGKNAGLMEGLPTGFRHVELTGGHFLSVPGPVAAQRHTRATIHVGNEPQRAAARTKRNVLAPTMRCRLRHWSCPSPAKALLSRIVISTAQRWPYSRTISSALNVRSVVKKAAMAGGGFLWPCRGVVGLLCRRSTTTRTRRPGNPACHRPHQA